MRTSAATSASANHSTEWKFLQALRSEKVPYVFLFVALGGLIVASLMTAVLSSVDDARVPSFLDDWPFYLIHLGAGVLGCILAFRKSKWMSLILTVMVFCLLTETGLSSWFCFIKAKDYDLLCAVHNDANACAIAKPYNRAATRLVIPFFFYALSCRCTVSLTVAQWGRPLFAAKQHTAPLKAPRQLQLVQK